MSSVRVNAHGIGVKQFASRCGMDDEPDAASRLRAQVAEEMWLRGVETQRLAGVEGEHLEAHRDLELALEEVAELGSGVLQHAAVVGGVAVRGIHDLDEVEVTAGVVGEAFPDDPGVHLEA